jgi:predicted RNase H-like nuclease (RuvC/YqgF family)
LGADAVSEAICAACEQPITKGQKFVLAGTEVFHRTKECVARIASSKLTRLRQEATRLAHRCHHYEAQEHRLADALEGARRKVDAIETRVAGDVEIMKRRVGELERIRLERDLLREQMAAKEQLLAQLKAANDRLQAAVVQAQAQQASPASDVVRDGRDGRDDAEVRFSLLEIDEP